MGLPALPPAIAKDGQFFLISSQICRNIASSPRIQGCTVRATRETLTLQSTTGARLKIDVRSIGAPGDSLLQWYFQTVEERPTFNKALQHAAALSTWTPSSKFWKISASRSTGKEQRSILFQCWIELETNAPAKPSVASHGSTGNEGRGRLRF